MIDGSFISDFLSSAIIFVINLLIIPIRAVLAPIDLLLSQIKGIDVIPETINSLVSLVVGFPSTLVSLFNINPVIWNLFFFIFIAFITFNPIVAAIKRFLVWVKL